MLAEGGVCLFLTNQAGNHLNLAFGEVIVKVLQAGLNSSSGPRTLVCPHLP